MTAAGLHFAHGVIAPACCARCYVPLAADPDDGHCAACRADIAESAAHDRELERAEYEARRLSAHVDRAMVRVMTSLGWM